MNPERPLTRQMLKTLYECHLRETEGKASNPFSTKSSMALIKRGMLQILPYPKGGKLKDALYITRIGRKALEPFI